MSRFLLILSFLLFSVYCHGISKLSHDGYIVKFKTKGALTSALESKSLFAPRIIEKLNIAVINDIPKSLSNSNDIEYIEPNYFYHTMDMPNDPRFGDQWALNKIDAVKAWDITKGSKDIIVAVIDTGVDYNHADLKENMWINEAEKNGEAGKDDDGNGFIDDIYGYDFANTDGDPQDDHNHGTHCAGVIGAVHNDTGISGINANVKIMALKFLTGSGSGTLEAAIKSIMYAVDNGANVLSNSWGGGGFTQSLKEAIEYARDKGVLFVAAAGNEYNNNDNRPTYPASYEVENIVAVAATDSSDVKAGFSNYGKTVHIAAPGVNVLSTVRNNGYQTMSGTSMACPQVAGAAALMLSHEDIDFAALKDRLIVTSDYVVGLEEQTFSGGRLNLYNMLMNIEPTRPTPPSEGDWISSEYLLESVHPYEISKEYNYEIVIPEGASLVRLHFEKIDIEASYDSLSIKVGNKEISLDGAKEDFYTKHFEVNGAEKIFLTLKSDYSVAKWGFKVDKIQIQ